MLEIILVGTLVTFVVYITYVVWYLRKNIDREHVYYVRIIISDNNPNDLYAQPYHPFHGSMIVSSKPLELVEKINHCFNIREHQNVFIEHVQVLN